MKNKKFYALLWLLSIALMFVSCGDTKPKRPPVDLSKATKSGTISVPYTERNNSMMIPVKLNGVSMDMIYDTGFSGNINISLLELQLLAKQGQFSESDVVGSSYSCIADGSIVENGVIRLHSVQIAEGLELKDVLATVVLNQEAPLLIGKKTFDEIASSIEQDNVNKVLNITPW